MANLSTLFYQFEQPCDPFNPTPDALPIRSPLLSEERANAVPPVKNWSHPFKDKRDPLQQLTHLAKAAAGFYPLGVGGLWHGGVHFDGGTAGTLDQSSVQCLADGEVVAYRIDQHSPTTAYRVNKISEQTPFSRNFVLVRHRLQLPKVESSNVEPPSLIFYSLYMHLLDWAVYAGDEAIARPPFWSEGAARYVKGDVNDAHSRYPGQKGLNVRIHAQKGPVLALLPRGAQVTVSGEGDYRKLENTVGPDFLKDAEGALRGYIAAEFLRPIAGGQYRVTCKTTLRVRAEPRVRDGFGNDIEILVELPNGTEVTVSGEGTFRKLEHINQYVHYKSLQGKQEPLARDQIVVLDKPVPIKAGDLIGHIGLYQDWGAAQPEKKLHLEVFSGDDVEVFIKNSRAWAKRLPASAKTWLKFVKGTAVVTHQDYFASHRPPSLYTAHALSDADLLVPKSLLDRLPVDRKISVPAAGEKKACTWYRLDGLLHDANNTLLDGWVCEEIGVTPWFSPWEWEGYEALFNFHSPRLMLASFLRAANRFSDEQLDHFGHLADAGDKSAIKQRLFDIIDRNRDGQITAQELQAALNLPAHAQSISQLIVTDESEWRHTPQKWDALDELLGHSGSTPHLNWLAEKERIRQLGWWGEVAEKVGLPEHGSVYHFHPVGLVGSFSTANPLEITHTQLKQIFPAAADSDIEAVLNEINGRLVEFKLDTRLRQRHFFAQIKGEVGSTMKGVTESWEYSPAALKSFSIYYRAHPDEAEEDGYLKDAQGRIVRRANQQNIGRKHFQRLNGNRASHPDDGYNFRGRGLIQLTGYEKYHNFMRDYKKHWKGTSPDTVDNPDLINEMPTAIRSAIWFWTASEVYAEERGRGRSDVEIVTKKVNGGRMGLEERIAAYEISERVLK